MNVTPKITNTKPVIKIYVVISDRPSTLNHKISRHLVCVSLGLAILCITTYLGDGWALHMGPAVAGIPNLAMEILDWIRKS